MAESIGTEVKRATESFGMKVAPTHSHLQKMCAVIIKLFVPCSPAAIILERVEAPKELLGGSTCMARGNSVCVSFYVL